MKATALRELDQPLSIEELELPRLGRGQVRVRMQLAAVCHSQKLDVLGALTWPRHAARVSSPGG